MELEIEEFYEISRDLEKYHAVFYKMWEMGVPVFTEDIPTAAIRFSPEDGSALEFLFNPEFWKKLSVKERHFIICHEMLHVIFNHGMRFKDAVDKDRCNSAMDITINHTLLRKFGFDRSELPNLKDGCFLDTVFGSDCDYADDENYEFYYNRMKEDNISNYSQMDIHDFLSGESSGETIERLNETLSDYDKEMIQDIVEKNYCEDKNSQNPQSGGRLAGKGTGGWHFLNVGKVVKKRKWESVIKKWSRKYLRKADEENIEQWARLSRRFSLLSEELMLPTEIEDDKKKEDKISVFFFLDTSGSCWGKRSRFMKAAKSLPEDRFQVRAFSFDTGVQEIDLEKNQIYGGGGTFFHIMEDKIQQLIRKEGISYPEGVFVLTDGCGNEITCEKPDKWYWFLTKYGYQDCIPKESAIYDLKNYA